MTDLTQILAASDAAAASVAKVIKAMADPSGNVGPDALKAIPCPRCGTTISALSTVTRNLSPLGLPVGMVDVEIDLMPMAEHIAACPLIGGAS